MTNEGSTYIVNIVMVPVLGRGKLSHIMKMHYLLKSSYLLISKDQTNSVLRKSLPNFLIS